MSVKNNPSYEFYKKYHQNKINKIIHILCIPLIVWSFSVFLNSIVINFSLNYITNSSFWNIFNVNITLSFILLSFYLLIYSILDFTCFQVMSIFLFIIWSTSYLFLYYCTFPFYYALIVNIISWVMQFIGHGVFEGNRPALMDSIKQAFLMAPLFSYYEFKELLEGR